MGGGTISEKGRIEMFHGKSWCLCIVYQRYCFDIIILLFLLF